MHHHHHRGGGPWDRGEHDNEDDDEDAIEYDEDLDYDPFSDDLSGVDPLAGFAMDPIAKQRQEEEVRGSISGNGFD